MSGLACRQDSLSTNTPVRVIPQLLPIRGGIQISIWSIVAREQAHANNGLLGALDNDQDDADDDEALLQPQGIAALVAVVQQYEDYDGDGDEAIDETYSQMFSKLSIATYRIVP
jgi:hypothetical protein